MSEGNPMNSSLEEKLMTDHSKQLAEELEFSKAEIFVERSGQLRENLWTKAVSLLKENAELKATIVELTEKLETLEID